MTEETSLHPLNIVLFGASGMVGGGVLLHLLDDPDVASVLSVGRRSSGLSHPKLTELLRTDFFDYSDVKERLRGYDACFFTLGRSSVGLSEAEYTRDTFDLTLAAAKPLLDLNPGMSFCYVSGKGTDNSEQGKLMWARVKGRTENALLALPFAHAGMVRLGAFQAAPSFKSRTAWIRWSYALLGFLFPLLKRLGPPGLVLDGPTLGRAMIRVAQGRSPKTVLQPRDLAVLGAA